MEQNQEPRNKPRHNGELIFDKGAKNTNGGNTVSSINGPGIIEYSHVKE